MHDRTCAAGLPALRRAWGVDRALAERDVAVAEHALVPAAAGIVYYPVHRVALLACGLDARRRRRLLLWALAADRQAHGRAAS